MAAALDVVGNPSSAHREGRAGARARRAGARGRRGARRRPTGEIVFTSGATEANNLALRGVRPGAIVTTAIEHASVLETARARGGRLAIVGVDAAGRVAAHEVVASARTRRRS
jgi:cysteine desulfurase